MTLDDIRALVADDFAAVNRLIGERLHSDVALVNQLSSYIVHSGGKRLRPLTVLLAAGAAGYRGQRHIDAAAIIEFIHTATLLHDDVVDASELRRGRQTANALFGNEASVLVGDFLYSRSFQMMVDIGSLRIMTILADTTNTIAEGEVMQLMHCHDPDTTVERYMDVIRCKTAKLFEAAALLGPVLAQSDEACTAALGRYGLHLGYAFQLIDDVLDYSSTAEEMGKNVGDDLAEGKPTLPLLHALTHGTPAQVELLRHAIEHGGRDSLDGVLEAIASTGALEYTAQLAHTECRKATAALAPLPASPYKDALLGLADFAVGRRH